jgi:putative membrane protein
MSQTASEILTTTVDDPDSGWRRLSMRMLLVHPFMEIWRALPALIVLVFLGRNDPNGFWPLAGVAIVVALGLIRWFTTTYRVTPSQIQVRRGLLSRSTLSVPRDRVRTVDLTSHVMHRLLGLTRITIGTGQSDTQKENGLRLDALTTAAAQRLRRELLHGRTSPDAHASAVDATAGAGDLVEGAAPRRAAGEVRVLARFRPSWVRFAPFTLSGFATIGVIAGFLANLVRDARIDLAHNEAVIGARDRLDALPTVIAVLVVILIVILAVMVLSIAGYVLAAWNFTVTREGGNLHVMRGLLTTRATTIEERRLRGAEMSEPLLLRTVNGARAAAVTTGLRVGRGAERGGTVLMPATPARDVAATVDAVLRTPGPMHAPLTRHGRKAARRRFTRALAGGVVIAAALLALSSLTDWLVWLALATIPIAALIAWDRYRNLGHTFADGFLVSRQGSIVRRRYMLHRDGVIGWNEHQSFFQRRSGLVTLAATTAAGKQSYEILDVDQARAIAFADRVTPGLLTPFLHSEIDASQP